MISEPDDSFSLSTSPKMRNSWLYILDIRTPPRAKVSGFFNLEKKLVEKYSDSEYFFQYLNLRRNVRHK